MILGFFFLPLSLRLCLEKIGSILDKTANYRFKKFYKMKQRLEKGREEEKNKNIASKKMRKLQKDGDRERKGIKSHQARKQEATKYQYSSKAYSNTLFDVEVRKNTHAHTERNTKEEDWRGARNHSSRVM